MSTRIIENLPPEDQARAAECLQQMQFGYVQLAELFRRGAAGLELTAEEYALVELIQKMASMFSSGLFPSKAMVSNEKVIRVGRELMGAEN